MTNEEKQNLIKFCNTVVSDIKSDAVAHEDEIIMSTPEVFEIALATLTAQPVKLPKIKHPAQFDYADEVIECLKSHNIEVQE